MRTGLVLVTLACVGGSAVAAPLSQKVGKEAAKGAAAGLQQNVDLGKSSREVVGGAVDSLVSRREKVEMLANDVGRELVRGAVGAGGGALSRACGDDPHCVASQARAVGYSLGEGVAQGISAKLSVVPSMLGFALGFLLAATLAALISLLASHRRREPLAPMVPRAAH